MLLVAAMKRTVSKKLSLNVHSLRRLDGGAMSRVVGAAGTDTITKTMTQTTVLDVTHGSTCWCSLGCGTLECTIKFTAIGCTL